MVLIVDVVIKGVVKLFEILASFKIILFAVILLSHKISVVVILFLFIIEAVLSVFVEILKSLFILRDDNEVVFIAGVIILVVELIVLTVILQQTQLLALRSVISKFEFIFVLPSIINLYSELGVIPIPTDPELLIKNRLFPKIKFVDKLS